ncbi:MAG: hypothetical protein K2J09_01960, partial [Muribaculaceae bacterium]|nr:hypothetical protein [Muribaculaceae bacterium]
LYELQTILSEIDRIKIIRGELPIEVQDLEDDIVRLQTRITNFKNEIEDLRKKLVAEKAKIEEERNQAISDLYAVYYVIGTSKELKDHGFVSGGGFLRKEKVLDGEFDRNYMTRADRRSLTSIPTDAPKANVKTNQPKDSYSLERGANGNITLVITDAERFWAASNLLVIEVKD